jgi:hypothetical protein
MPFRFEFDIRFLLVTVNLVELIQRFVCKFSVENKNNFVSLQTFVNKNVFQHVNQLNIFYLNAEFFPYLAHDGFAAAFAVFDSAALRTIVIILLDRVEAFGNQNPVSVTKQTNSDWSNARRIHIFFAAYDDASRSTPRAAEF